MFVDMEQGTDVVMVVGPNSNSGRGDPFTLLLLADQEYVLLVRPGPARVTPYSMRIRATQRHEQPVVLATLPPNE